MVVSKPEMDKWRSKVHDRSRLRKKVWRLALAGKMHFARQCGLLTLIWFTLGCGESGHPGDATRFYTLVSPPLFLLCIPALSMCHFSHSFLLCVQFLVIQLLVGIQHSTYCWRHTVVYPLFYCNTVQSLQFTVPQPFLTLCVKKNSTHWSRYVAPPHSLFHIYNSFQIPFLNIADTILLRSGYPARSFGYICLLSLQCCSCVGCCVVAMLVAEL